MEDRIRFIEHEGKKILLLDFSHVTARENILLLEEAKNTIAQQSRESVLTLADMTGAEIDRAVATKIKEVLAYDRPYVKRSAWVGSENVPHALLENFEHFSQRRFIFCKTREEALAKLVED
jgi:hypothetical protein